MLRSILPFGRRTKAPPAAVPPGVRVYAIGDSHGCVAHLRALHAAILEDAAAADGDIERRVIVYLGDYIDRGPDSRGLVGMLIEAPLPDFESVFLLGNHDATLLRLIDEGQAPQTWILNGAFDTLESYGVDPAIWTEGSAALRAAVKARVPPTHVAFLRGLKLSHIEGDYFFAHAGIRPGVAFEDQVAEDLLWIRDPFLKSKADHGKVVVHGHTPSVAPEVRSNRIGIDTGAVYGGVLTALVLEGTGRRFLQADAA